MGEWASSLRRGLLWSWISCSSDSLSLAGLDGGWAAVDDDEGCDGPLIVGGSWWSFSLSLIAMSGSSLASETLCGVCWTGVFGLSSASLALIIFSICY